jgi:hypothetical protein
MARKSATFNDVAIFGQVVALTAVKSMGCTKIATFVKVTIFVAIFGMNTKAKGRRNEYRSMRILESAGYACTREVASLGVFDVIGIESADCICLQVKTRDWPAEMETLAAFRSALPMFGSWSTAGAIRGQTPDVREI